jgi:hypothetical protein
MMATDLGKKRRSVLLRCAAISAATLVLQLSLFWGTRPRPESTLQVSSLLAMIPGVELAPGAPLTFPSINDHAASLCPVECGSLVRNASIGIIETDGSTATRDMGVRLELVGSPALFQRIRALQVRPTTELLTADVPIGETHPGIMAQREQMTRAALLTLLACPRDKTVTSLQAAYGEEQGQESSPLLPPEDDRFVPVEIARRTGLAGASYLGWQRIRVGGAVFECRAYMTDQMATQYPAAKSREWRVEWWAPGIGRVLRIHVDETILYSRHLWRWGTERSIVASQLNELLLPQSGIYWRSSQDNSNK